MQYIDLNNGLKYVMFNIVEYALGKSVQSCHAPIVSTSEMHSLVHHKAVADTIFFSVLSNIEFLVPIAETIEK